MTTKTDITKLTKRASEVKLVLSRLIALVEAAEAEAAESTWTEEKTDALVGALSDVCSRCYSLGYELTRESSDTVLTRSDSL
jgi:hypothetical protein